MLIRLFSSGNMNTGGAGYKYCVSRMFYTYGKVNFWSGRAGVLKFFFVFFSCYAVNSNPDSGFD